MMCQHGCHGDDVKIAKNVLLLSICVTHPKKKKVRDFEQECCAQIFRAIKLVS